MRKLLQMTDPNLWSQVSALVFGLMFLLLVIWVFIPSRRSYYKRAEKLPIDE